MWQGAKVALVGERSQVIADVHDAEIDQKVADPRSVKCLVSIVQPGPKHASQRDTEREEKCHAPAFVEKLMDHNHMVRHETEARNHNGGFDPGDAFCLAKNKPPPIVFLQ